MTNAALCDEMKLKKFASVYITFVEYYNFSHTPMRSFYEQTISAKCYVQTNSHDINKFFLYLCIPEQKHFSIRS